MRCYRRIVLVLFATILLSTAIAFADTTAYLNTGFLNFHTNSSNDRVYAFYLDKLNVISDDGNKARVEFAGYEQIVDSNKIRYDYPTYDSTNPIVKNIIDKALKYRRGGEIKTAYYSKADGNKYSGENSIRDKDTVAFDCIGFVRTMIEPEMKKYVPTYSLPVSTVALQDATTLYNKGFNNSFKIKELSESELEPGDLILFKSKNASRATHVGMYLGNGDYIHATHGWGTLNERDGEYIREHKYGGVFISNLSHESSLDIVKYIRVIPDKGSIKPSNEYLYAKKTVTLRASMSNSAASVKTIKAGQFVKLQYTDLKGAWGYVVAGNKKAYCSIKNLSAKCIQNCDVGDIPDVKYNGKAQKPGVKVYYKGAKLSSGYYLVTYSNNKRVGTAKITIKGNAKKGFYGSKTVKFKIVK